MNKTLFLFASFLWVFVPVSQAQVTTFPYQNPKVQFFDSNGLPCAGCLLNTYIAGTTTAQATYSDNGVTQNANPVVLDSAGRATIYLTSASYKFVLTTSLGVTIWTQDNVTAANLSSTVASLVSNGTVQVIPSTAATSGANQSGPNTQFCGNFWNGASSAADCWTFQDVLGTGTNPTSTLTVSHSGSSGTTGLNFGSQPLAAGAGTFTSVTGPLNGSVGATTPNTGAFTTLSASGAMNANGNSAAGNVALKNPSADQVIYVSTNGNDSNDGLSWGTAKLTPQAAMTAATATGTKAGVVRLASGSYACPTTYYSDLSLIAENPLYNSHLQSTIGAPGTALNGVVFNCNSGTDVTISGVSNLHMEGINYDLGGAGGGFIMADGLSASSFDHLSVGNSGSVSKPAMKWSASTSNMAFNTFYDLVLIPATTTDCLDVVGSGTPNAGKAPTDNEVFGFTCSGFIKNGISFGLNTDTNRFYEVKLNNTSGASNGDALVFNSATPGSDQDADNEILKGVCTTGLFNNLVSMGTAFGNLVEICGGAGEATIHVLGGSPAQNNTVITTGLFGISTFQSFGGVTNVKRIKASNASALVTGDVGTLSAGWGTTASVASVSGTDMGGSISITSNGTGQGANPTFLLTFHDGTWGTAPAVISIRNDANSPAAIVVPATITATTVTFQFLGTPVAGTTYKTNFIVMGTQR